MLDSILKLLKKENLEPRFLFKELFLYKDHFGQTLWHWIVQQGSTGILEKWWGLAKEAQLEPQNFKELLLTKDNYEQTIWHLTETIKKKKARIKIFDKLLELFKEVQLDLKALLVDKNCYGQTLWYLAVKNNHPEILDKLWELGKKVHFDLKALLLDKANDGQTLWHLSAKQRDIRALERLWMYTKELQLNSQELKELLLAKDDHGQTALYLAAQGKHWRIAVTLLSQGADIKDLADEQCSLLKAHVENSNDENKESILQLIEGRLSTLSIENSEALKKSITDIDLETSGSSSMIHH
jgi:ankyrin repeat protein